MKLQQGRCAHKASISRAAGQSSTAAAAYRAGVCITDERTGEIHDYERKKGVEHSEIVVPGKASAELQAMADMTRSADPAAAGAGHQAFWVANEKAHKRGDSTVAREIEVDLPLELSAAERLAVARQFGGEIAERYGVGVQISIHEPRTVTDADLKANPGQFFVIDEQTGERHNGNFHVHFLLTTKQLDEKGFGKKSRALDPTAAKYDGAEQAAAWTKPRWEQHVQAALDAKGVDKIYTTRSADDTRALLIERGQYELAARVTEPTRHMGPAAAALERRGEATEVGDKNREIRAAGGEHLKRSELIDAALKRVTDQQSVFSERDLCREICKLAPDRLGDELRKVVDQAMGRLDVVMLGVDAKGRELLTTKAMLDTERGMIDGATARRGEGRHAVDAQRLDHYATARGLSDEQAAALRHMSGRDGVALVEGMAGTGKSTMMRAASEAWQEAGYTVRGAALAGKAADGLEQGAGIKSQTVHSLLGGLDSGRDKLTRSTILVVDEAGMLSSGLTARLVDHAQKSGAKLVMIGDDRQLQPIQAGGAFGALKDALGAAKLTTIYRQKDSWARDSVHAFADGKAGAAIKEYAQRGLVSVGADAADAKSRLVADWRAADGSSAIMLAGTRADVRDLNALARAERVRSGEIEQGESIKTDAGKRDFSAGDRVVFLKNDRAVGVKNGQLGTVESIQRAGDDYQISVRGDDGKTARFALSSYDKIDHGYATTVHKAQGVTVDRAYVLIGSMHDRELSYVSMSRSRDETRLYVDASKYPAAAAVARQMSESHKKGTTLDHSARVAERIEAGIKTWEQRVERYEQQQQQIEAGIKTWEQRVEQAAAAAERQPARQERQEPARQRRNDDHSRGR